MNEIKNKYILALSYPTILISVSIIAVLALFAFILPGIFEIVNGFENIQLPKITILLKKTADGMKDNRKTILGITGSLITLLLIFLSTDT
jgi:type II secretory pathway component PulF